MNEDNERVQWNQSKGGGKQHSEKAKSRMTSLNFQLRLRSSRMIGNLPETNNIAPDN